MRKFIFIKNLKSILFLILFLSGIFVFFKSSVFAYSIDSTVDPIYKYAWSENVGWINFGTANGDVHITDSGLSGSALSENVGWIDLSNVVNDGEGNLSGYAWGENVGWINFSPTNGGVVVNSLGEFTGSALSENIGWIIFDTDYQVKTDWLPQSERICTSWTYSDWSGCSGSQQSRTIISSSPANCTGGNSVLTQSCTMSGGGSLPQTYTPPTPPSGGFGILIQNGAKYTNNRAVSLKLNGGTDAKNMAISNSADFSSVEQEVYQTTKNWTLTNDDGVKTVYVKFYTQYGQPSQVIANTIILDTKPPTIEITQIKDYYNSNEDVILTGKTEGYAEIILAWDQKYGLIYADEQGKVNINLGKMSAGDYKLNLTPTDLAKNKGVSLIVNLIIKPVITTIKPKVPTTVPQESIPNKISDIPKISIIEQVPKTSIIEQVPEIIKSIIPEILKPKEEVEKPQEIIIIPKEVPFVMNGEWNLLSEEPIKIFVFSPLPKSITNLVQKFPTLEKTFNDIGITRITDVAKLQNVILTLPGLTERVGLPTVELEPGKFAIAQDIPISDLSQEEKQQMPTEVVFAKTGGEAIDLDLAVSVSETGQPQEKISMISGGYLQLSVKPDNPVSSVRGYLVFKSRGQQQASLDLPSNSLLASIIFGSPVFAQPLEGPVKVEEKLVLLEFEYIDFDKDGIYTAEIQVPVVDGEYEIITVLEFVDPELGRREIRLTTVIDPEGYVYEKNGDKETRIPDVNISLFWLNPQTNQYELWSAKEYQQKNPQITDVRGTYSFLVPEGDYYIQAEAPGYIIYTGENFQVREGSGVHFNIELKSKNAWLKIVDWKATLLIIVILLLFYNFYKDKKRDKFLKIKK